MKRKKCNKRRTALAGMTIAMLGSTIASLLGNTTNSLLGLSNAKKEQRRNNFLYNNQALLDAQAHNTNAANADLNNTVDIDRTNNISTLNSGMKCGGTRRMKKVGGTISANVKGLDRYI